MVVYDKTALSMTTASTAFAVPFRDNRFVQRLCGLFLVVFTLSAIHPIMLADWILENLLVLIFVAVLASTYRKLALSDLSYLLVFVYLCMHEWGAHHKYANVPMGEWMRTIFHTVRNDYDRVVHFAFGFLLAYPEREVLMRKAKVAGPWTLWLPVLISLGFGAAYEILEAVAANLSTPEVGDAFLGLQGDPWDTHKDMFMSFAGSAITMTAVAVSKRRTRSTHRRDAERLTAVGR
jgi:putative membrane protein